MACHRIYPTLFSVPRPAGGLAGKAQVDFLRRCARRAVAHSAALLGVAMDVFDTDKNGVPLPCRGIYWSLSHKPDYVAGVAAPHSIGIDVEKIRIVSKSVGDRVMDHAERRLLNPDDPLTFFRFWTAKESVVKQVGIGLAGLSHCRIGRIIDDHHLTVNFQSREFMVAQIFFADHVAAVLQTGEEVVEWRFEN